MYINRKPGRTVIAGGPAIPRSELDDEPLLELRSVHGEERLSAVYQYRIELVTPSEPWVSADTAANLDLKKMVGRVLTLTIELDGMQGTYIGAGKREISGVVFSATYLGQEDRRGRYEVIIKPWIALAQARTNYRVFQRQSVTEIIDSVLTGYPFSSENRLGEDYPLMDFQIQHGESDFTFIQRLMEEHGISWFYEHEDGFHRMVLVDNPGAYRRVKSEAYHELFYHSPEQRIDQEHISEFTISQTWQAGRVTLGDYDFKQPGANLTAKNERPQQTALKSIAGHYEWPGDYTDMEQGEEFARIRMQEIHAKGLRAYGKGNLRDVECGTVFTLTGHPQKEANRGYLVIAAGLAVTEKGDVTGDSRYSFETTLEVQPDTIVFRPERTIPKPRCGPQTAVVTSAPDYEIWPDQYGRVKIRFAWDRLGPDNLDSSCWVRVSSSWAGSGFGSVSIPRVGEEVIVDFVNGDPDRPLITGRVYNRAHMPPWELPGNEALAGYRSKELDGARSNSLVFDDTNKKIQVQVISEEGDSRLALGYITRIAGNEGREEERGRGFELRTDLWGVVRALKGLFVTTEGKPGGQKQQAKDVTPAVERLAAAHKQHTDMARLAQRAQAQQEDVASQDDAAQAINEHHNAIRGGKPSQETPFPEFAQPNVAVSSAAGIVTTATDSTHLASGNDHVATAGRDVSVSAGRSFIAAVHGAISLFAYQLGMKLIAAKGKVEIQAQGDEAQFSALKDLTVSSANGKVVITAAQEVWIGAGGSYVCINGEGVVTGSPGPIVEKGAWRAQGPDSQRVVPAMSVTGDTPDFIEVLHHYDDLEPVKNAPYRAHFSDGTTIAGKLDASGFMHLDGVPPGEATLELGQDIRRWKAQLKLPNGNFGAASDAQSGMALIEDALK